MGAKVTGIFDRGRRWQPAPERATVAQPATTLLEQLHLADRDPTPPAPNISGDGEVVDLPVRFGPATIAANQRQRLRHANELLRTFTKTA